MTEIAERPQPSRARQIGQRFLKHENAVLLSILAVIIAALAVMTKGLLVSPANVRNILFQISSRGIASIGQTLVLLTAGIDLSIEGAASFTICLGGLLMTGKWGFPHVALPIAILVMLLGGLGVGTINGSLVSRIGMPPLIVTLALWWIGRGIALAITHQGMPIGDLPTSMAILGRNIAGVPVALIVFIGAAAVMYFVLHHTTFGRSVYAVGGNEVSAWLSGINTKNIRLFAYVISGFLAALAGLVIMGRSMSASSTTPGALTLDTIAAVCVGGVSLFGGRGTIVGSIIGVLILGVLDNGMNLIGLHPAFKSVIKGVIIIVAVAVDVIRRRR